MIDAEACATWNDCGCGWLVDGHCERYIDDDRAVPPDALAECPLARVARSLERVALVREMRVRAEAVA